MNFDETKSWISLLREDARDVDGVLVFSKLPLFVALGPLLDPSMLIQFYEDSTNDFDDEDQEMRLESLVLNQLLQQGLKLTEIFGILWDDDSQLGRFVSIGYANIEDITLFFIYYPEEVPSFHVIALGSKDNIFQKICYLSEQLLPRLSGYNAALREVKLLCDVPWSFSDLQKIITTLTGKTPGVHEINGAERLIDEIREYS